MESSDPFDLQRFIDAQASIYSQALGEIAAGEKRSHWMWFIFPQIGGLGTSAMAAKYAIRDRAEAAGYRAHPLLGSRLEACCRALEAVDGRSAHDIFGSPDDLKLRSSMTLFDAVAPLDVFDRVLKKYYDGRRDSRTLELLDAPGRRPPIQ